MLLTLFSYRTVARALRKTLLATRGLVEKRIWEMLSDPVAGAQMTQLGRFHLQDLSFNLA